MHEALDAVVELDEDAERRDARDDALELLADELRHVLDLLHVGRLAFRLDGDALALGGPVRDVGERRAQLLLALARQRTAALERLAQQAVHDEVRIAADRRGEVCVVARGEAEVAETLRRVARLLHRTQRDGLDDARFGLSLDLFEHLLHVHRPDMARLVLMDEEAERAEQVVEVLDLLLGRLLVHAVHEGQVLFIHVLGDGLVRREHAFLDDGLGERALALDEGDGVALLVELDLDLGDVEVDGAAAVALGFHDVPQFLERLEHRQEVALRLDGLGVFVDEDFVDDVVGEAAVDVDDGGDDLIARDLALGAHLHLAGHREAVDALVEAADAVGERERQHRDDAVDEVNARAALARLAVERLALAHVPAHIGDVDAEEVGAVRLFLDVDAVVEVLGVVAVDGDDGEVAAVAAALVLIGRGVLLDVIRSVLHVLGELLREVVLAHDGEHVDARVALLAEHLDDLALRVVAAGRPFRDLDDDLRARARAAEMLLRHEDVVVELRVVRRHEGERLVALERADDPLVRALDDADDLALARAAFLLRRLDARHDAVAVHGRAERDARHEDVRILLRLLDIGDDEAKALRRHRELADNEVHAARDAVEVAAVLDDERLLFQRFERRGEGDLFLCREVHAFSDILRQHRAESILLHIGEDAVFQICFHIVPFTILSHSSRRPPGYGRLRPPQQQARLTRSALREEFRSLCKDGLPFYVERQQMAGVLQTDELFLTARDMFIEIARARRRRRMVALAVHDERRLRDLAEARLHARDDAEELMHGDERHARVALVHRRRHIAHAPPALRRVAARAEGARRQLVSAALRSDVHGRCEAHDAPERLLHREQEREHAAEGVADDGERPRAATQERRTVAHGVEPVLRRLAAQILLARRVTGEPHAEHRASPRLQKPAEEQEIGGTPREPMHEQHALRPARQEKRLRTGTNHPSSPLYLRPAARQAPHEKTPSPHTAENVSFITMSCGQSQW